jgi:hypothetical protein
MALCDTTTSHHTSPGREPVEGSSDNDGHIKLSIKGGEFLDELAT